MSDNQIFIGGTGRSGTTIMAEVLGTHRRIHTYMRELRFITDPDGLSTLCNALTGNFSPPQARAAIQRFTAFMLEQLSDPLRRPYRGFNFNRTFGPRYREIVEAFVDRVAMPVNKTSDYHLSGGWLESTTAPAARLIERLVNAKRKPAFIRQFFPRQNIVLSPANMVREGHYFADRAALCAMIGEFVDELLSEGLRAQGKTIWCEQTPTNAMHAGFINEILPNSHFILARRDPRGVMDSFLRMRWAPDDPDMTIAFIRNIYAKWEVERAILEQSGARLLIVRIEDLSSDPDSELARIAAFLGVENEFPGRSILDRDKLESWRKSVKTETQIKIARALAAEIEAQGYDD